MATFVVVVIALRPWLEQARLGVAACVVRTARVALFAGFYDAVAAHGERLNLKRARSLQAEAAGRKSVANIGDGAWAEIVR